MMQTILENYLIATTGAKPSVWEKNTRVTYGDEDQVYFDFEKLTYDFVCGLSVYDSQGDLSVVAPDKRKVVIGYSSERGKLALAWIGELTTEQQATVKEFYDDLDWAAEFEWANNGAPKALRGEIPQEIATCNLNGEHLNKLAPKLKLNLFLYFAHKVENLRTPERIKEYESQSFY